jgi:hypothetical protein
MRSLLPALAFLAACVTGVPGEGEPAGDADADGKTDGVDARPPLPDAAAPGFTRYAGDAARSPITLSVANRMHEIAARRARDERVFMKVGASGTVSRNLLFCFAGEAQPQYRLALGGRDGLLESIRHFREGRVAAATPFDRVTEAAMVGKTASWVQSGDPSPLERELAAANPRFAFVNYGTNDMGMASTYAAALPLFHEQMSRLLDRLEAEGVVPIVSGLNPRSDREDAARWVPTFDAMTRGMAEARQLPYISLYVASADLPALGLGADGLHGNVFTESGAAQPCVFDAAALRFNYNVRNLLSIEALDAARRVLLAGEDPAEEATLPAVAGDGSRERPFVIDRLPFTHSFDTRRGASLVSRWSCGSQNEGGPEVYYRLALDAPATVRAAVMHRKPVDVDVHVGDFDGGCLSRADVVTDRALPAGEHAVVVDSFVSSGGRSNEGPYLLVVHAL